MDIEIIIILSIHFFSVTLIPSYYYRSKIQSNSVIEKSLMCFRCQKVLNLYSSSLLLNNPSTKHLS